MWSVSADPLKFEEAVQWFRNRVPVTDTEFKDLSEAARRRAFMVSGVAQLDLTNDVFTALEQAVSEGTDFAEWKKEVGEKLQNAWGDSVKNPAWRLENIYRTNVQSAYAAGRYKQQTDPDVIKARPFWLYDSVLDSRTSTICRNLNGTLLPADDPFWQTRYPPNHFGGCRSGVRSFTRKQTERRGVTENPTTQEPDVAFRHVPSLDDWVPGYEGKPYELARLHARKFARSPAFDDFLEGKGLDKVPVAALDDELADKIRAEARTVLLSEETLAKNQRNHPELPETLYRSAQDIIDNAQVIVQDTDRTLIFLNMDDRIVYLVIKATRKGDELYLTSLHYADESDIGRAKRKGVVVRERK